LINIKELAYTEVVRINSARINKFLILIGFDILENIGLH
jgi:hypothetical protein